MFVYSHKYGFLSVFSHGKDFRTEGFVLYDLSEEEVRKTVERRRVDDREEKDRGGERRGVCSHLLACVVKTPSTAGL